MTNLLKLKIENKRKNKIRTEFLTQKKKSKN